METEVLRPWGRGGGVLGNNVNRAMLKVSEADVSSVSPSSERKVCSVM